MTTWQDLVTTAPDLASAVRQRFEASGLALLATLRADGSPRISGIETLFADGHLWLGMMPTSRKVADLERDPRLALHAATIDKQVAAGDAKVAGVARRVPDDDHVTFAAFRRAFTAEAGTEPPPGPFALWWVDVHEVSFLRPAGDHLDIDVWTEASGERRVEVY